MERVCVICPSEEKYIVSFTKTEVILKSWKHFYLIKICDYQKMSPSKLIKFYLRFKWNILYVSNTWTETDC